MGFRRLVRKEIRSLFPLFAVYGGAVTALHAIVMFKGGPLGNEAVQIVALLLPFLFASAIVIGIGYFQLSTEWKTNSIYLLLSLPIRGWKVLLAKLGALLLLLGATLLWIAASYSLFLLRSAGTALFTDQEWGDHSFRSTLSNLAGNSLWMYLLSVVLLVMLVQFAFLSGQLVARFRWVMALIAFFAGTWVIYRIAPFLSDVLSWLPDFSFGGSLSGIVYLHSGLFAALVLLGVGLAWLNGYLFEKVVEV
ncbi:hypothetical protein [Paenibacillus sacheonensis]|uniref:Uncharacterized protein n=1 Tax=Paenibacillus sacheonensis TaxID=742054 RepID=A0A7X4YPU0_9BACL|nr:hypothetical protein [Paenibacillus sacheonensis]MBM7564826.1 magnesium-transporting ATPase (P-type) [Paenibacillus sacheonensis]NBC69374.1 hypothetical protein [Paenibacillus sacheonensis]